MEGKPNVEPMNLSAPDRALKVFLDLRGLTRKGRFMQNPRLLLTSAALAASLFVVGCNREPEVIHAGPKDTQAADLAKAKPVTLPPSIVASRAYRCKDNSLIYLDFMSDQKTAIFRATKGGDPVALIAPEPGTPFVAPGYSLTGSGTTVTFSGPGKGSQSCKA